MNTVIITDKTLKSMTIEKFIEQFSHNNEVVIENRDCYAMDLSSRQREDGKPVLMVMDWEIRYTDIADCEMICISNVHREPDIQQVITLRIDTDRKSYAYVPEKVKTDNCPLWLYNHVHHTDITGAEAG